MGNLASTVSEFLRDLRAQKLRTFLTIFGIVWGTVAIVVLISFGMGFKRQMAANMHGIGESIAIMFPGRTTKPFEGFGIGRPMSFTEDDVDLLKAQVKDIESISAEYSDGSVAIRVGQNIMNTLVAGVYPVYAGMRNIIPDRGGRFIDAMDMLHRRRVALIGDEVKNLLFGESDAIGKIMYVGSVPFTVVGVMVKKTQPSSYNRRDQDRVFIPSTTFASVFGASRINNIIWRPHDPTNSEEVNRQVREVLGRRYRFDATDEDAVWIWDTANFDKFQSVFFLAFNIFMGVIGSFTLAVGGIGVANIMYIVVQERTREIGVRRAVGAKKGSVMLQFFTETFFIVAIGSAIGFMISVAIIQLMKYLPIKDFVGTPELSGEVVIATVSVISLIGLAAGLLPARRAANLNVVECLRS